MQATDKNDRALGRVTYVADMDAGFSADTVIGRVYCSYTPVFTGPIDPALQKDAY